MHNIQTPEINVSDTNAGSNKTEHISMTSRTLMKQAGNRDQVRSRRLIFLRVETACHVPPSNKIGDEVAQ